MSRPEHILPPELFYNEKESARYAQNSRILQIQADLAQRAYDLLEISEEDTTPKLLLDLGCGSGISGSILSQANHHWFGLDISESMLQIARENEEIFNFDLFLADLGQGLGFRAGSFDGAISVSVLQWLCNADKSCHNPTGRIHKFFSSLMIALARGSKAVFQFYPENEGQIDLLTGIALKCGFGGGVVVDYPNSKKAKKYYLVLHSGYSGNIPAGLTEASKQESGKNSTTVRLLQNSKMGIKKRKGKNIKDKQWILRKKQLARKRGNENVPRDSKYTARKRGPKF
jgi:18S rRNA (guanine1575-N7)-methyltransferase